MKKVAVYVLPLIVGLSACDGGSSTDYPSDNRDTSPVNNTDANAYTGRVMDGYLRNAFVWLDLDNDLQVDYCARNEQAGTDGEGNPVVELVKVDASCEDEPSAFSVEGGKYSLDLTAIQQGRDARNVSLLDPREYSVLALAIPGITIDEANIVDGNEQLGLVDKPYFLMGTPYNNVVSPLTTLVKARLDAIASDTLVIDKEVVNNTYQYVRNRLGRNLNLGSDYQLSNTQKMVKYAEGVRLLIQKHTPDSFNLNPQSLSQEGLLQVLTSGQGNPYLEVVNNAISRAVLSVSQHTMDGIDAAAGEQATDEEYANVEVEGVEQQVLPLTFENPYVLVSEVTKKAEALAADGFLGELDNAVGTDINVSTRVAHSYTTDGKMLSITVDGCRERLGVPSEDMGRLVHTVESLQQTFYENTSRFCGVDGLTDIEKIFSYSGDQISGFTEVLYEVTIDPVSGENTAVETVRNEKTAVIEGIGSAPGVAGQTEVAFSENQLQSVRYWESSTQYQELNVFYTLNTETNANIGVVLVDSVADVQAGVDENNEPVLNGTATRLTQQEYQLEYVLIDADSPERGYRIDKLGFTQHKGEESQRYVWEYNYYNSSDGDLEGLLEYKTLYEAKADGSADTGKGEYAKTEYSYKKLLDAVFE